MPLHLTPALLGQIAALNRRINHEIVYSTDESRTGKADDLRVPVGVTLSDDCDGYVWRKMLECQTELGIAPEDLRPVLCWAESAGPQPTPHAVNHCVLAIVTDDGTFILTNGNDTVMQWQDLRGFRMVQRLEPDGWRYVGE